MYATNFLNKKKNLFFLFIFFSWIFHSCQVYKKVPVGEVIYQGARVTITPQDNRLKIKTASLVEQLQEDVIRPEPNSQFFGFPYKAAIYYWLGTNEKKRNWTDKIVSRFGETPILLSQSILDRNKQLIQDYLRAKGYFGTVVETDKLAQKHKATAHYRIQLPTRYKIQFVDYQDINESSLHSDFFRAGVSSLIKAGDFFDFSLVKEELKRLEKTLRSQGYYYFSSNYIGIEADSTQAKQALALRFFLKPNLPERAKKQYLINDIYVFTQENGNQEIIDLTADMFRGVLLFDSTERYKQTLFTETIGFRPGNVYSEELAEITRTRLVELNNFRFVQSRFEVVNRLDSTLLNVYYYLIPQKKKSLRTELNAITRSNGLSGSQVSINWKNSNTFKGAEQLVISAIGGIELQLGGPSPGEYRDNYRFGLEANLLIPRFWLPYGRIDPETSRVLPKTVVNIGYENFIKSGLYNLNSLRTSLGYTWRQNAQFTHTLSPLNLNFVRSSKYSEEFIAEIFLDPRLLSILDNQLIPSGSYQGVFTPKPTRNGRDQWSVSGGIDLAGNLVGLFHLLQQDETKRGKLFGETFAQYARFEGDIRYRHTYNPQLKWANRLFLGVGIPYGNSLQLPFVKQYFSGGNNSIRAFRARAIGPGTYQRTGNLTEQFLGNNTGDIKIELNTELRYKVTNFIETAFFVDAGNVWMYKDPYIYDEGALFTKDFYKQLAIGSGIGLRLDFSFIIFRMDLATPLHKPWLEQGSRWTFDTIQWNKAWRQENLLLNLGVGYPF